VAGATWCPAPYTELAADATRTLSPTALTWFTVQPASNAAASTGLPVWCHLQPSQPDTTMASSRPQLAFIMLILAIPLPLAAGIDPLMAQLIENRVTGALQQVPAL
jgi:hypothetical protein